MKKLARKDRNRVGYLMLSGHPVTALAREHGVSADQIIRCGEEVLRSFPGYEVDAHIAELRLPGNGPVKALRAVYMSLLRLAVQKP